MKLDKNYKVPEGFEEVLNYREDPQNGTPIVGEVKCDFGKLSMRFWVGEDNSEVPPLPFKGHGELYTKGWDIPFLWAVDASGQCWCNEADGGFLTKTTEENLLRNADSTDDKLKILQATGNESIIIPLTDKWFNKWKNDRPILNDAQIIALNDFWSVIKDYVS